MLFLSCVNLLTLNILDYRTWDAHGIKPDDLKASQILLLHHPSLEDLENQLADLIDDEKSKMSNAQYKKWCMLVNSGHLNALSGRDQSTWKRFIKNIGATRSFRTVPVSWILQARLSICSIGL